MNTKLNEETIKNRIVIPLFKSMDFSPEEIEYEVLVTIQLGHSKIDVSSKKDQKKGFLDILYKKINQPIFVVETKPQSHPLTLKFKTISRFYFVLNPRRGLALAL